MGFELHELVIYEDFKSKIVNFCGEMGKLFVMVDDRYEVKIKMLKFEQAQSMTNPRVSRCVAEDFDMNEDYEFLQAFSFADFIPSGCLIVSDFRFVKVSHTNGNEDDILSNYFDYLPMREDQQLLMSSTKIGWKHRRVALTFNFPETCQAKLVQI